MDNLLNNTVTTTTFGNDTNRTQKLPPRSRRNRKRNTKNSSRPPQKKESKKAAAAPKRPPKYEYISKCCEVSARKPVAGKLFESVDPNTNKTAKAHRGLGHWRCSQCGKSCRVTPRAAKKEEVPVVDTALAN